MCTRQRHVRHPLETPMVLRSIQNIRRIACGKGLANGSRVDREIWAEFGHRPSDLRRMAAAIRAEWQLKTAQT
jgi:hypothetical protein